MNIFLPFLIKRLIQKKELQIYFTVLFLELSLKVRLLEIVYGQKTLRPKSFSLRTVTR